MMTKTTRPTTKTMRTCGAKNKPRCNLAITDKMGNTKKLQCINAVANQNVCDCLSNNLPVVIDFVQYVAIVTRTKEDLEYDKQSKEDKQIIDNTRAARDKCLVAKNDRR